MAGVARTAVVAATSRVSGPVALPFSGGCLRRQGVYFQGDFMQGGSRARRAEYAAELPFVWSGRGKWK